MPQLTDNDHKQRWRHVTDIVGISKQDNVASLESIANHITSGNLDELAKDIERFFNSVSSVLPPLPESNRYEVSEFASYYHFFVNDVEMRIRNAILYKASSPGGITSWMLRELSSQLAGSVVALFNS